MTITEAFNSSNSYGVTYVSLDESGMSFESESAVHLEDGSLLTLRMPTRQSEKLAIHALLCQRKGLSLAA
ncbi:MAG TPA: type III secretion system co-regulatory protein PtrC [Pseudomonas sp.]|nr:type III secretion system co-regulatory protein PtrC [Pseudomonas sp.]